MRQFAVYALQSSHREQPRLQDHHDFKTERAVRQHLNCAYLAFILKKDSVQHQARKCSHFRVMLIVPLLVVGVFAGLALDGSITPREEMQPLIEDALNQIEFISGPVDSTWGSKRAELGFPEPWPIRYVEIGNEDWLAGGAGGWETYKDYRFPMFLEAIGARYPDIQVIASGAGFPGDWDIPTPGAGDHHMYSTPDGLLGEFDRFDNIITPHLIGEMAGNQANGGDGTMMPYPFWIGAVGEAVALIGYERNADRIIGAAYVGKTSQYRHSKTYHESRPLFSATPINGSGRLQLSSIMPILL